MFGKGQWNRLWPELSRDLPRILFAGEHLSENWQGFMEGALETGRDAADKV
jgi:monoamine oxidase